MHPLDEATTLVGCGPGRWQGRATDTYWNMVGPHGGVIASILLRGVLADEARIGDPCAMTVNFTAAITPGDFEVSARIVRTGNSIQHWYVELRQNDVVATNATIVCSARRTTWRHQSAIRPIAPPPEALEPMRTDARSRFLANFDLRFVEGSPVFGASYDGIPRSARTCLWLDNATPRPLDFIGLTTLCDAQLWSPEGVLLATTSQIVSYR